MGVRYFCDGCDEDVNDEVELESCAGDCFGEFCDDCLEFVGDTKRYCEECVPKEKAKIPGGDLIGSPLLNPVPLREFQWPWQEESVAT